MPLGWIDFSKSERSKVLGVLDMLTESGTLDELGIAPIRDGFADLFFPGTSTIQTRAKYFLIVPYALKDLEHSGETNPNRMLRAFDAIERQCGEQLLENGTDVEGIIGNRSLALNRWVKRTPADLYWRGLRSYGIFTGGSMSLLEYARAVCVQKKQKSAILKLGNRNDTEPEKDTDDKDAGVTHQMNFWNIPTYAPDWMHQLSIKLTPEEGAFLKHQIIVSFPNSLLSYILKNELLSACECKSFQGLATLIGDFPDSLQKDYFLAYSFSSFLYVIRTLYNRLISDDLNERAVSEWSRLEPALESYASVDLDSIFSRLKIWDNVFLYRFLQRMKKLMTVSDRIGMETEIRRRERELKQSRAKTQHAGEFDPNTWYGGQELDYRFTDAMVIVRDIFESEEHDVKSK